MFFPPREDRTKRCSEQTFESFKTLSPFEPLRGSEEVRHLARVQDAVDVLKHRLVHNLRVDEEEGRGSAVDASGLEERLEVLAEGVDVVALLELDADALVLAHVRRQPRARLLAGTADADAHRVALVQPQHARERRAAAGQREHAAAQHRGSSRAAGLQAFVAQPRARLLQLALLAVDDLVRVPSGM